MVMTGDAIRALIVDDEPPARRRLRALLQQAPDVEVIGECRNGREAADAIRAAKPDLLFLDIQMPELDGFEVLDEVGRHAVPAVVFVSAYDDHAIRAFGVEAQDYLLKPFERERFMAALGRARRRVRAHRQEAAAADAAARAEPLGESADAPAGAAADAVAPYLRRIAVRTAGRIRIVDVDTVEHFEAEGNYVRIHAGERSWLVRDSLGSMAARLDPARFLRIHRGTIVRLDAVVELEPLFQGEYHIRLRSGSGVRSSRRYRARLHEALSIST